MARNTQKVQMTQLEAVIDRYGENKDQAGILKKKNDADNLIIKNAFSDLELTTYQGENYVATLSRSERTSLNEERAIEKLKAAGIKSAIKIREYIDEDELENLIYNDELDPELLSDCMETKFVDTLRIKKRKKD